MFLRMHFVLIRMNPSMQCDPEFFRAREANIDNGNKFVSAGYLKPSNNANSSGQEEPLLSMVTILLVLAI